MNEKINHLLKRGQETLITLKDIYQLGSGTDIFNKLIFLLEEKYLNPNILLEAGIKMKNLLFIGFAIRYKANYKEIPQFSIDYINETIDDPSLRETILSFLSFELKNGSIDPSMATRLAIILDEPKYFKSEPSLSEIIRDHSHQSLFAYRNPLVDINLTIKYLNLTAFKEYLKYDIFPSYAELNDLILLLNHFKQINDKLSYKTIKEMLLYYLLYGGYFDPYQFNLLSNAKLIKKYDMVFERRESIFNSKTDIDNPKKERLKILSFIMQIDPYQDTYNILDIIKQAKQGFLKRSILKYIVLVKAYDLKTLDDYRNIITKEALIKLKPRLDRAMYDKNNQLDIIFQVDDINWPLPTDFIEEMLSTSRNPFTRDKITDLQRINELRSIFKRLGLPIIFQTVKNENRDKRPLNNYLRAQFIRETFYNLGIIHQVTPDLIDSLDLDKIKKALSFIKQPYHNIDHLDLMHAHMTFYHISLSYIEREPDNATEYFNYLKIL